MNTKEASPAISAMQTVVILGVIIYAVSFFMPVLDQNTTLSYFDGVQKLEKVVSGWWCAWMTLRLFILPGTYTSFFGFGVFSGLLNPFMIAYLASGFSRRLSRARTYLAVAILFCIVSASVYLYSVSIRVGFPMWVAGAILIVSPEISTWRFAIGRDS